MQKNKLNNLQDITSWLQINGVRNATVEPHFEHGFVVHVEGHVNLSKRKITHLPIQFGTVSGDFDCRHMGLVSLLGAPLITKGSFLCNNNELTSLNQISSLKFCPKTVRLNFNCSNNPLKSLEFSPRHILKNFDCFHDGLTSLEFCPTRIDGNLNIVGNKISNFEFIPQNLGGRVYLDNNPILKKIRVSHGYSSIDFEYLRRIHEETVIKLEQKKLSALISNTGNSHQTLKI